MERHLDRFPSRESLRLIVNRPAACVLRVECGSARQ
jgi:hypothetical protein